MEKRDNNFTTAELKILAEGEDPISPFEDTNEGNDYEDRKKRIVEFNGFDYEKLIGPDGADELIHESLWFDLSDMIHILAWKILYERKLHRNAINKWRRELLEIGKIAKEGLSHDIGIDDDIDTKIKEGDEEDYYDEFEDDFLSEEDE